MAPERALTAPRAVVLVEGESDKLALEALAERRGRRLGAEGVSVVAMGGSKNISRFLDRFGPQGAGLRLAGLCDAAEERDFQRGLERAGFGANLTRADLEALGFFTCVADLEDELIRALGVAAVEQVIDAQGELGLFRIFQRQPPWLERSAEEQLRPSWPQDRVRAPAGRRARPRARAPAAGLCARPRLTGHAWSTGPQEARP
jgi:hypothetical protein